MPNEFSNVRLRKSTHEKLVNCGGKRETFDEIINRLLSDIEQVNFEVLSVDGTPPNTHILEYQLGNARYSYNKGKYALVDVKA